MTHQSGEQTMLDTILEVVKIIFYASCVISVFYFIFRDPNLNKKNDVVVESLNKKLFNRAKNLIPQIKEVSKKVK